jgi:hypothetical protein
MVIKRREYIADSGLVGASINSNTERGDLLSVVNRPRFGCYSQVRMYQTY